MSALTVATRTFPVVETFGPTIQGEGALAGLPTYFIRFGGCDYRCSWCDSMYAVEPALVRKAERLNEDEITERLAGLGDSAEWVTLSGGNPALFDLGPLVFRLRDLGYRVAIETQGSKFKPWLSYVDCLTVSPKPPSSGMTQARADLEAFLPHVREPTSLDALKIVVFDQADLDWARDVLFAHPDWPGYLSCGTDPPLPGETYAETIAAIGRRYEWLCGAVAAEPRFRRIRVLPQLHVLAYGHARGV